MHPQHPSVDMLSKNKSVETGTVSYLNSVSDAEQTSPSPTIEVESIEEEKIKIFNHSGEKYFKILVKSIKTYKDKQFKIENIASEILEKDDIAPGTYITNKIVCFADPYNVYCKSDDVEPVDLDHSAYLHIKKK
eukprot:250721_1